jgi:integrase
VDWKILRFIDVNDQMVGYIHDYFLNNKSYANKTYNNNMALLSAFTTHVTEKFSYAYKNPFLGVPDMVVTPKTASVRQNEFERLLVMTIPENGIQMKTLRSRKNQKKTNHYKPWLKHAFRLGLYTGGRSEDIVELKWSDILLGEDGKFDTLKTIDHKIDSANSNRTSITDHFVKYFAITKELGKLLL